MFGGVIQHLGKVQSIEVFKDGQVKKTKLSIATDSEDLQALPTGSSVAVNGCCLTKLENHNLKTLLFDLGYETLKTTNLGGLRTSDTVHLETPLTLNQGLDGHLLTGHIDALVQIQSVKVVENTTLWQVQFPTHLKKFIAQKGCVALDGVSLTVNEVDDKNSTFSVGLIPHTLQATRFEQVKKSDTLNLEVDLIARYLNRQLSA